jgi:hypothetical protein
MKTALFGREDASKGGGEKAVLFEVRNTRQIENEGLRRWFTDPYFDLIVWYDREGTAIAGFQLCYDKERDERALTWRRGQGFDHKRIDDGEVSGRMKMTPVLVPDGTFDYAAIAERFRRESRKIDPEVREFVHKKLTSYANREP